MPQEKQLDLEQDLPFDKNSISQAMAQESEQGDDYSHLAVYINESASDSDSEQPSEPQQPEQTQEQLAQPQMTDVNALMSAGLFLNMVSGVVGAVTGASVSYSEQETIEFAQKTAPFLNKYGGSVVGMIEKYSVEIAAVSAVAAIGGSTLRQVKQHKAEIAVNDTPETESETEQSAA